MSESGDIESFLASYPPEVQALTQATRSMLLRLLPGITETLDQTARLFGYSYGPGYKGVVCTLILSQTGVRIGIVRGAELPDPRHLMEGSGKVHRGVVLQKITDLKRPGLTPLIKTALASWRKRNRAKS